MNVVLGLELDVLLKRALNLCKSRLCVYMRVCVNRCLLKPTLVCGCGRLVGDDICLKTDRTLEFFVYVDLN
jgi:hypothetical protein